MEFESEKMNEAEAKKIATKKAKEFEKKPEFLSIEERYLRILPNNDKNNKPVLTRIWYSEFMIPGPFNPGTLVLRIDDKGNLIEKDVRR